MLTRREWLAGWSNLPAAFSEYRKVHPDEGAVYYEDLLDFIRNGRFIAKLSFGAFGRVCPPLAPHWDAIEPLLLSLIEEASDGAEPGLSAATRLQDNPATAG